MFSDFIFYPNSLKNRSQYDYNWYIWYQEARNDLANSKNQEYILSSIILSFSIIPLDKILFICVKTISKIPYILIYW